MTRWERESEFERLRKLVDAHELTSDQRVRKNTLHVAIRIPHECLENHDPKTLSFAAADISALYRASAVTRDTRDEQDFSDAKALARAPSGEHARYDGAGARAIRDVLLLMGFNGPSDTETCVCLTRLQSSHRRAIITKCEEVLQLLNLRKPTVKESPRQHITCARNVLRLLRLNFKSEQVVRGAKRTRKYRIAEDCEGFFSLVADFNPYPRGPPTATDVPYSRQTRHVNVFKSKAVKAISKREHSRVDPLPVTVPSGVAGFVTSCIAGPAAQMHQESPSPRPTCSHFTSYQPPPIASRHRRITTTSPRPASPLGTSPQFTSSSHTSSHSIIAPHHLSSPSQNPHNTLTPSDADIAELQSDRNDGCLAEFQSDFAANGVESDEDLFAEYGCYADELGMQDDSDYMEDCGTY